MPSHRGKQKSLEKKKKRRIAAARSAAAGSGALSRAATMKLALASPFGPAFMSATWEEDDDRDPPLVSVVLTRALPGGTYLALCCLVDRTCLGVKDAFIRPPMTAAELDDLLDRYDEGLPGGIEEVEVLEAQSVIFHAIDYARELGFAPHPDFPEELAGPRPERLIDTPLAHPPEPRFMAGPDDDVPRIMRQLARYRAEQGLTTNEEEDIRRLFALWLPHFEAAHRDSIAQAYDDYFVAALGRAIDPKRDGDAIAEHASSLPATWGALWRPMADGRTGIEHARSSPPVRAEKLDDAVARLARARVVFGDVITLDRKTRIASVRDVFDEGTTYRVRVDAKMARGLTRWTRLFGVIVELADGTFYPPSTVFGHAWLRNVTPRELVEKLNTALGARGYGETVDPQSPHAGLLRWVGIAEGLVKRLMAPTPAQAAELAKKLYLVNGNGERLELHEATLRLPPRTEAALVSALQAADDVEEIDDGFEIRVKGHDASGSDASTVASLACEENGEWSLLVDSVASYERALARLSELAGERMEVASLEVTRPWEQQPKVAAEEGPDTKRLTVTSQRLAASSAPDAAADARALAAGAALRALDEDVPAVGGRPRDVVTTPEGRARVEAWLMEWELGAVAEPAGWAFVDLDHLRAELGLPTVM